MWTHQWLGFIISFGCNLPWDSGRHQPSLRSKQMSVDVLVAVSIISTLIRWRDDALPIQSSPPVGIDCHFPDFHFDKFSVGLHCFICEETLEYLI